MWFEKVIKDSGAYWYVKCGREQGLCLWDIRIEMDVEEICNSS